MTKTSSKASVPLLIEGNSISKAYSRLLLHIVDHPGVEVSPLVLTVDGFPADHTIPEDLVVRSTLDALFVKKGKTKVEDVAFTTFPEQLWIMAQGDRAKLFQFYRWSFPFYRARHKANSRGLYFERLTMYGSGPCDGNQLEWILSEWILSEWNKRDGVRDSMAQVTTFDPARDHTASAQLKFPCLQHVSFVPTATGLVINAFYATQQLFDKAYGNYLGLAQLGAFMAHEMKMPLARLNVNVGVAKLERIGKTDSAMIPLINAARACISPLSPPVPATGAIPHPAAQAAA